MADDYVTDLRAFCAEWLKQNQGCDLIDHGFGPEHGGELTAGKLVAVLDELERLRKDVAKLGEHVAPVDDREPMDVNDAAEELYAYVNKRGSNSRFGNQLRAVLDSRQSWRYRAFKLEDDVEQLRTERAGLGDAEHQSDADGLALNADDLRVEVYRNLGVNGEGDGTVAVRVTHGPTGLTAVGRHATSSLEAKASAIRELLASLAVDGGEGP